MGREYTEAQAKASVKYVKEKTDQMVVRVPKGDKDKIKEFAKKEGYDSLNAFVIDCIKQRMKG